MSIIYDALQKVQKNITEDAASPLQPKTTQGMPQAKPKTNPILFYIFVVCLGSALGNFAYNFFIHQPKKAVASAPVLPSVKQPVAAQNLNSDKSSNPETPLAEPSLVLNGVFFEQGEGYALINNKIVRLGDEIDGAKVKEIAIDGVTLDFNGKIIKLSSPSS